jgi:hypothetical protein
MAENIMYEALSATNVDAEDAFGYDFAANSGRRYAFRQADGRAHITASGPGLGAQGIKMDVPDALDPHDFLRRVEARLAHVAQTEANLGNKLRALAAGELIQHPDLIKEGGGVQKVLGGVLPQGVDVSGLTLEALEDRSGRPTSEYVYKGTVSQNGRVTLTMPDTGLDPLRASAATQVDVGGIRPRDLNGNFFSEDAPKLRDSTSSVYAASNTMRQGGPTANVHVPFRAQGGFANFRFLGGIAGSALALTLLTADVSAAISDTQADPAARAAAIGKVGIQTVASATTVGAVLVAGYEAHRAVAEELEYTEAQMVALRSGVGSVRIGDSDIPADKALLTKKGRVAATKQYPGEGPNIEAYWGLAQRRGALMSAQYPGQIISPLDSEIMQAERLVAQASPAPTAQAPPDSPSVTRTLDLRSL